MAAIEKLCGEFYMEKETPLPVYMPPNIGQNKNSIVKKKE